MVVLTGSLVGALGKSFLSEEEKARLLNASSRNVSTLREEQREDLDERLDRLEEMDRMRDKMGEVNEKVIKRAVKCLDCNQLFFKKEKYCVERRHRLETVKAKLRYFECR